MIRQAARVTRERWRRVFKLRRALVPHVVLAGERPPAKGEHGPQKFVVLTDDLDNVLFSALAHEAALATKAAKR